MWLHVTIAARYSSLVAVPCLFQEWGITGIMFCHQPGGPVTGWAYKRDFKVDGLLCKVEPR